jgi:hypothetical protein
MAKNPISVSIVLIRPYLTEMFGEKPIRTSGDIATGFFFWRDNKFYLATNKHVIYKKDEIRQEFTVPKTDEFKLSMNADPSDTEQKGWLTLKPLKWIEHINPIVDVILVPLEIDPGQFKITAVDNSFLSSIPSTDKIFTAGYPASSFRVGVKTEITIEYGRLLGHFNEEVDGQPRMLGDIPTAQGMSGSPVLDETGKILIGIHSGRKKRGNSDLGANIWFSQLISEIIDEAGLNNIPHR